jgi:hypothetical protein
MPAALREFALAIYAGVRHPLGNFCISMASACGERPSIIAASVRPSLK